MPGPGPPFTADGAWLDVLGLLNDDDVGRGAVPAGRRLSRCVGGGLRVLCSAGPGRSARTVIALILAVDGLLDTEDTDERRSVARRSPAGPILVDVGPPKF